VQSFNDAELARLGRVHSAQRAIEAVTAAREAGCTNVSVDLMLWLPGQTQASWRATMDRAIHLSPDHLSLYLLELYPNAPLKEAMARATMPTGSTPLPARACMAWTQVADDAAADMYLDGLAQLDAAGYEQYEISNVSRPGRMSRHNLKYWQSGSWRGFGCGAHSTVGARRWHNVSGTEDYVARVAAGQPVEQRCYERTAKEQAEETLFTGLRLSVGIDREVFSKRHGFDPWEVHGERLAEYVDGGFMWSLDARFGLTRQGMLVANDVLSLFV
jgi:oxygen-independent coproporphyrinogen-3 oxidase